MIMDNKDDKSFEDVFGSKARLRILKLLAKNSELSISQIIKMSGLNHSTATKHLNYLIALDIVQLKQFGRIRIYRYKAENVKASSLKRFIEIWEGEF